MIVSAARRGVGVLAIAGLALTGCDGGSAAAPAPTSVEITSTAPTTTATAQSPPSTTVVSTTAAATTTTTTTTTRTLPPTTTEPPSTVPPAPHTSCTSVVHIGDSTSVGMMSSAFVEDPALRLDAQYAAVGATDFRNEISGARSIVERLTGQLNADEVAQQLRASGYHGCWVLALGTTDAANIAVGSRVSAAQRIDRMMAVIGDDPVLWVDVKTLVADGAWSNPHMAAWNLELVAATTRYPNLQIYDWAAVVQDAWFQDDGIHYTSAGNVERARLIAEALATAYPG